MSINGLTLCGSLKPDTVDERRIFMELLPDVLCLSPLEPSRTICIMDRGYFSLKIINDMDCSGMKVVVTGTTDIRYGQKIHVLASQGMCGRLETGSPTLRSPMIPDGKPAVAIRFASDW